MKITFLIMTEYLKYQSVYTMLNMIKAAKEKNHTIRGIFLFGTGVLNITKNIKLGNATKNIPKIFEDLIQSGIPIYACQTWADNYGIFPEESVPGSQIVGLGELSDLVAESDKIVVFGSRS